jgi:hypothetical protein
MANSKISALTAATTPLSGSEVLPIVQSGSTTQVSVSNLTVGRDVTTQSLIANGTIYSTNTTNLPSSGGTNAFFTGGYGSPTTGKLVLGDGTGWSYFLSKRNSGTTTDLYQFADSGNFTFLTGNVVQGTAGKGINFTANTPASGMTSQLLNWYEEGSYTPTVAATSGTLTSYTAVAEYTRVGRLITFVTNVTITNAGTGAGALTVSLPFTANGSYAFNGAGRENALTGFILQGYISAGGTVVNIVNYSNATAIATNAQIRMTITYTV